MRFGFKGWDIVQLLRALDSVDWLDLFWIKQKKNEPQAKKEKYAKHL